MARSKKDSGKAFQSPFAVALRALMSEKPITTQEKLAEVTGKTRQTVSQYVNGISEPGYDTLVKIADFFNVSVDYLLGRSDIQTTDPTVRQIAKETGLNEKTVKTLQLLQRSKSDPAALAELTGIMWVNGVVGYYAGVDSKYYAPGEHLPAPETDEQQLAAEHKAKQFSEVAPFIADLMVTMVTEHDFIRENIYSILEMADGNFDFSKLNGIMSDEKYVNFLFSELSGEITAGLRGYLREMTRNEWE